MKTVEIVVIRNVTDYKRALKRISDIFEAEPGSNEYYELKILSREVESYENEHINLPDVDAVNIIKFIIEQRGLKQNDLVGILGDKTNVSKILNRKRYLTLGMIRNFCKTFNVPTDVMIREYSIL